MLYNLPYLALMLLNVVCTSLYVVLSARLMRRQAISPNLTIAASHLMAAALLLPALVAKLPPLIPYAALGALFAVATLKLLAKELHFYATANISVAQVTVFSALTPIFALFFGFLLLDETPTALECAGIAIVCFSIWLYFSGSAGRLNVQSLPHAAALLSTIPPALSAVFLKDAGQASSPLFAAFAVCVLIGSAALMVECRLPTRTTHLRHAFANRAMLLIALCFALAQWSYAQALTMNHIANTLALERFGILFQMLFAYMLLGEKQQPARQAVFGTCMLVGCLLVQGWKPACPRYDLSCMRQEGGWFLSAIYQPDTPVFMYGNTPIRRNLMEYHWTLIDASGSFNEKTAKQFEAYDWPNQKMIALLADVATHGGTLAAEYYHQVSGKSCAIVGGAGYLKGSGYGAEIDAHDVVMRMNSSPVKGYETDVGARTTFRVVNGTNQYSDTPNQLLIARAPVHAAKSMPEFLKHNASRYLMISVPMTLHMQSLIQGDTSTGLDAILLALHTCGSVSIFGFGPNEKGLFDYYYNSNTVNAYHNMLAEQALLQRLEANHALRYYHAP